MTSLRYRFYLPSFVILSIIILAGLILRLLLIPYYTHFSDMALWQYWGSEITRIGFRGFFNRVAWTDYLPLYFYILFSLNWLQQITHLNPEILFKLPAIIADCLTGIVIYKLFADYSIKRRLSLVALYLFNPAIFANSAMWGQIDGVGVLLIVSAVLFLKQNRVWLLGLILAIAILFKPLYVFALVIFVFVLFFKSKKLLVLFLAWTVFFSFMITLPFVERFWQVPELILARYLSSVSQYQYASVNAFNFWGALGMNWISDNLLFLKVPLHSIGSTIFGLIILLCLVKLFRKRNTLNLYKSLLFSLTILFLGVFTFETRAHERHLLTGLGLLNLFVFEGSFFSLTTIVLSLVYLANLYFGIEYLYTGGQFIFSDYTVRIFSLAVVVSTVLLIFRFLEIRLLFKKFKKTSSILVFILILAAFLRLYRIDFPRGYIFDEVYHGFTAVQYTHGSKEAWEWWTIPPKGVAFEWTHPPLAKEIMAGSLMLFHTSEQWGWRVPGAILGVASIYLVYLLGKQLFRDATVGLLSAFIFSLDGLNFVQSRTGMNDIYLVTFMLASLYFFVKRSSFLSAVFVGLALASKWTALYLFPMYGILLIAQVIKQKELQAHQLILGGLLLIIPVLLYLGSYIPFFWLGHSWNQFKELQWQMWYYHTHLKATHDYSSPWWSWPLNLYPVWYYVEYYSGGLIANIFAFGNPVVFWVGFSSILTSLIEIVKKYSYGLMVCLIGYLVFLLPWALSPRIMFLYHYSPCVPFLSLLFGYQLAGIKKVNKPVFYTIVLAVIVGFLFIYPFVTGVPLPQNTVQLFFSTNLAKDPFR